jgi:hypothetical protein
MPGFSPNHFPYPTLEYLSKPGFCFGNRVFGTRRESRFPKQKPSFDSPKDHAMNPDLRRRTDDLCARLNQLRDSL